ncbi:MULTISPECIES: glycine cleavage system protein GcvH [Aerococcus]|uniref:Glycine cleavage system H protein n=1 Tax=Aerococcus sanguinicola TaxID=119206 RepID=A0A5N1GMW7_9LACT|nr:MULTISPECIES: glycine cleavage system protein GcvH [Aerococcus]KAA9302333.1 glycine cleavage system protein GcvH [Aerococcus sanguinicola]MDK6370013.1 glycine cleavage system protein GcvH [Aerococcus sp. UMB9870]MDK6678990.1 glycine cleavage system protein GcvH [Aerococcus sp. UMB8608]MDK6687527.1 glycine cleavage system protein GcvH [Aerococcus sp. UMB8623]MDK6939649.1 glycine cleavage system protein GcvH [Aerococcus sp. UMB8487]
MAKFYTEEHEWLEIDGKKVRIGLSDYAVEQLGEIVYVELPDVDDEVEAEEDFSSVESVKSTSEVYAPADGKIVEVNERLDDEPEFMNESPADAWIAVIETEEEIDTSDFMDEAAYKEFTAE